MSMYETVVLVGVVDWRTTTATTYVTALYTPDNYAANLSGYLVQTMQLTGILNARTSITEPLHLVTFEDGKGKKYFE